MKSWRQREQNHWFGDGAEGAKFWLSIIIHIQAPDIKDIFIT